MGVGKMTWLEGAKKLQDCVAFMKTTIKYMKGCEILHGDCRRLFREEHVGYCV